MEGSELKPLMGLRGVRMSESDDEDHERVMKALTSGCTSGDLQSTGESEMDDVRKLSSETGQAAGNEVKLPELDCDGLLARLNRLQAVDGKAFPHDFSAHPISRHDAARACQSCVRWSIRTLKKARDAWWDLLIDTDSPEERLSARRMIDGLNRAIGMQWTDGMKQIARREQFETSVRIMLLDMAAQDDDRPASEDADIERWR